MSKTSDMILGGENKDKKDKDKKDKKAGKHGMKSTHVEHHTNGSHTAKHQMNDGSEISAGLPDDAALQSHMSDMLSSQGPAAPAGADAAAAAGTPGTPVAA